MIFWQFLKKILMNFYKQGKKLWFWVPRLVPFAASLLCTKLRVFLVKNENGWSFCKYVKYVCVFLERRASQPLSCIKKVLMIIHRKSFARRRLARELAAISSKSSRASGDSWISISSNWIARTRVKCTRTF